MVIDASTWEACGEPAAEFTCRPGIAVRGRSDSLDLYVLPLNGHRAAVAEAGAGWTGQVLAGRYRIDALLGSGGMASAYLARDRRLERSVVIKVPHAEVLLQAGFRVRFAREVRHLTRLEHPHVVRIYDVGEHERVPYAVVQHLAGGDLRRLLERTGGRMRARDVPGWLREVAGALDFLHAAGYVHRDVKPENILFDEEGHAYLSDLGIATALRNVEPAADARSGGSRRGTSLTGPGLLLGAPNYTPPEAFDRAFAPPYDQYGLGVVVYEALSGSLPFEETSPGELLLAKLSEAPVPLGERAPDLPARLCAAVMRSLARDPGARFASCGAFARALSEALPAADPARP
jgi:serine/threonine-protein kinase